MKSTLKLGSCTVRIRAKRRNSGSTAQPLKPKYSVKRLFIFFVILMLCGIVFIQQNFEEMSPYINPLVSKVRIENQSQQLQSSEVRAALEGFMGNGFFNFDVTGVKVNLEKLPWISKVSVKRIWPDTLSLEITEQVAIARWGDSQLLNQHAEIFSPAEIQSFSSLPKLRGPEQSQFEVMQQYQIFSQILSPSGLKLTELSLSTRRSWELTLNEIMHVEVGRMQLMQKLERFVEFYDSQPSLAKAAFESIDLRYNNGIAVKSTQQDLTGVAIR